MNVLSPFDGISGGQIALERRGVPIDNYFASETNKFAMSITQQHYPKTIHLGDVRGVKVDSLPPIDLLIGGSPCQGFSFGGKQLNFADPRSILFFEFVRLLNETKSTYFLLENVQMKQEFQDVITGYLGVQPILINSALVSAQNRNRLYWTNIPGVTQPVDRGIVLADILDVECEREKSYTVRIAGNGSKIGDRHNWTQYRTYKPCTLRVFDPKTLCHHVANATDIGHYKNDAIKRVYNPSGKSPALLTAQGGNRETKVLIVYEATKKGYTEIQDGDCFDLTAMRSKTRRGRNMKDKSNCLTAGECVFMRYEHPIYRDLTPLECERLQTLPDNYTEGISKTQRRIAIGGGYTVEVISHILKGIKNK